MNISQPAGQPDRGSVGGAEAANKGGAVRLPVTLGGWIHYCLITHSKYINSV
jgi:hypothetical protein